jgi:hypothetical protein
VPFEADIQQLMSMTGQKVKPEIDELEIAADPKRPWLEPALAILMAVSSLCTAWCSYQNSRWSGDSGDLSSHAGKLERQATEQHLEARQIEAVHARLWMEAMDAQIDNDEKLARFYIDRFGEELKPAYEKWIALKPLENPSAPPHPFVPSLYVPRFEQEIRDAIAASAVASKQADVSGANASNYLGNTVLLATVLFFAGTAGKFDQHRVRWASFGFAVALFLYAVFRMVILPIA